MDMLGALPARSEGRRLLNGIFDAVEKLLRDEVASDGQLVTPLLKKQLAQYDRAVKRDPKKKRSSRAEFFRFNQFLALNMRDQSGGRPWREALVAFVAGDDDFRAEFDREAKELMLRLIDGMELGPSPRLRPTSGGERLRDGGAASPPTPSPC